MRFKIVITTCRRCNKPLATGNRSLYGADEAKARCDRICESCVTPEEAHEMNEAIGQAIQERRAI